MDKTFPFGLRSAPLIFTVVADALQWVMEEGGVTFAEHYIDDFIMLGVPDSDDCKKRAAHAASVR